MYANPCKLALVLVAITMLFCGSLGAEDPKAAPKQQKKTAKAAVKISSEREAAILAFVKANHAELTPLLQGLKDSAPTEYEAALVDLDKAVERLERLREKMPARYEAQLADWRLTSRIRLLAARMAVSPESPSAESELRSAIVERFETRLANQRAEAELLHKRLDKLNATIAESTTKKDELIEKEFAQFKATKPAKAATKKAKATKRPEPVAEPTDAKTGDQK